MNYAPRCLMLTTFLHAATRRDDEGDNKASKRADGSGNRQATNDDDGSVFPAGQSVLWGHAKEPVAQSVEDAEDVAGNDVLTHGGKAYTQGATR